MVSLLEFLTSVNDNERYVQIIAPWFLNVLNKMSNSKTSARVRKIDVFDKASKAHLGGGIYFRYSRKRCYIGRRIRSVNKLPNIILLVDHGTIL